MDAAAFPGQRFSKASPCQPLPASILHSRHAFGRKGVVLRRRVTWHHAVRISSQAGLQRGAAKIEEEDGQKEGESELLSGLRKVFNLPAQIKPPPGTVKLPSKSRSQAKSNKVVFVAGATGKVGSRTVRELLKLGFSVRASTRNVEKAQALFEAVGSSASGSTGSDGSSRGIFSPANFFGLLKPKVGKKLEIVECNLEDPDSIESALGNAGVVVCCIGASEKEVLDISGPYRIDYKATENLISAASLTEVSHFVLLTSLGTQKFGFPAAVLNLFWGVLLWKAKAERALFQSGIPYTIVRPGGMERPTDAYKETHNLVLAEADKLFGGQVSNLQVAELIASIVENPDVSVNKIVEAVAETNAPLRSIRELLEEISVRGIAGPEPRSFKKDKPAKGGVDEEERDVKDGRALAFREREEKRIQVEKLAEEKRVQAQREKETRAQAQKEKEAKRIQAERDEKDKQRLQELRKKYEEEIKAAREKEEAAKTAAAAAFTEKEELEKKAAETRAKAEAAVLAARQAKAVEVAVLAAAQKGNLLSEQEKEKILDSVRLAVLPKEVAASSTQTKDSPKKKTGFFFLGQAAPSSITTETVSGKNISEDTVPKSKIESKADEKKSQREVEGVKKLAEAKRKEEQERLDKEAQERAEKEATEAQQKKEAEARKKAEEEKIEAESKREEREKMEAEAKRKQEVAEAKKREEEERAKAEAELKRKEEEEKVKMEAEIKRKQEEQAEAKKVEEQEKVKEAEARKEEKLAETKKEENQNAEKLAEAKQKGEDEEKKMEDEAKRDEEESVKTEKKPDLEKAKVEEEKAKASVEEKPQITSKLVAADESRKTEGPPPRRRGFRWFWQPEEPEFSESEELNEQEVIDEPVKAEAADQLPTYPTPLSPYTQYPELKPPAPPIASPPAVKAEKAAPNKADPASFETAAIDQTMVKVEVPFLVKPSVLDEVPREDSQDDTEARAKKSQEVAEREREALEKAEAVAFSLDWPWQKSEEISNASAIPKEQEPASSADCQDTASSAAVLQKEANTLPPSSRPLSPYAQFPNLKPPSPPKPSSALQNGSAMDSKPAETLTVSSNPSSPYPGFPDLKPPPPPTPDGNGASAVESKKTEEPEPSVSFGFKWPWQQ